MTFTDRTPAIVAALSLTTSTASASMVAGTFSGTIASSIDAGIMPPREANLALQAISGSFSYDPSVFTTNTYFATTQPGDSAWFDLNAGSMIQTVDSKTFAIGSQKYFGVFKGNRPPEPEDVFENKPDAFPPAALALEQNYMLAYDLLFFENHSGTGPGQDPTAHQFSPSNWNTAPAIAVAIAAAALIFVHRRSTEPPINEGPHP